MKKNSTVSVSFMLMGILFCVCLVASNLLGDSGADDSKESSSTEASTYTYYEATTASGETIVITENAELHLSYYKVTTALFFKEKIKKQKKSTLKDFLAGIAVGIPNYFSSLLLLKSLSALPSFIVYTCFSTGALILVSIVSLTFFKERPTVRQIIGLIMVLAALVILNL